jgi:integrase
MKYLTDEQIGRFFGAVRKGKYVRRDTLIFSLMLSYGLRLGEAISIRLEDVDMNPADPQIQIRRLKQRQKKKPRFYELSKANYDLLKSWLRERNRWHGSRSDYLFITQKSHSKFDHMGRDCLYGLCREYGRSADIGDIHPHMFRHSCGVRLARAGMNAFAVQRRLGHSSVLSTVDYINLHGSERREEDRRAAEAVEF